MFLKWTGCQLNRSQMNVVSIEQVANVVVSNEVFSNELRLVSIIYTPKFTVYIYQDIDEEPDMLQTLSIATCHGCVFAVRSCSFLQNINTSQRFPFFYACIQGLFQHFCISTVNIHLFLILMWSC